MSLDTLLIATVAAIRFAGPEDLENAKFARLLAIKGKISTENIVESQKAVDYKIMEILQRGGDNDIGYRKEVLGALQDVQTAVQAQLDGYRKMLTRDVANVVGGDPDPAFSVGHAARPNGRLEDPSGVSTLG